MLKYVPMRKMKPTARTGLQAVRNLFFPEPSSFAARGWWFCLLAVLYLIPAGLATAGTFTYEGHKTTVSVIEKTGVTYFALDPVLQAVGLLREPYAAGQGFQIVYQERLLVLGIDSPYVILDGDIQKIEAVPLEEGGALYMPAAFFTGPLAGLLDGQIRLTGTTLALSSLKKREGPSLSNVELHYLGGFTKVVFLFKHEVPYSVKETAKQILINFPKAVQYSGGPLKVDDPIVESCLIKEKAILITLKQEDTTLSTYSLSNPYRLVLDIARGTPRPAKSKGHPEEPRFLVVLDPGHGGAEHGAAGRTGALEKDLTLKIARLMEDLLKKEKVDVLLTRAQDSAVGLEERAGLANNRKGNLFLSLHLNSFRVSSAHGAETYYMSLPAKEPAPAAPSAPPPAAGEETVAAPESSLEFILWDLAQSEYLKDSSRLAEMVQEEMDKLWNVEKRGVKQAPFRVLAGVTMPAALVEIGFLSNEEEEKQLVRDDFQMQIARSLVQAVDRFRSEIGARWHTSAE
jgi:N-acetylmuramoyl-L-alanine amidase